MKETAKNIGWLDSPFKRKLKTELSDGAPKQVNSYEVRKGIN